MNDHPLRSRLALGSLLVVSFLCCLPAADAPFTYDEHAGIEENRVVHTGSALGEALAYRYSPDQARPLFFASLLMDADLWGMQPRGFRLTGFLLHLVCGALLYLLLKRPPGTAPAALAGTALFLLHPLQSESVLYIWGRSEILSTLFGLGAMLLALQAEGARRGLLWAGAFACMALGLASKEEAVIVPIIFIMWWGLVEGRPVRPGLAPAAVMAIPVAVFLAARAIGLGNIGRQVYVRSVADNILGQGLVTLRMIRLLFLPFGQSVDHAARVPGPIVGGLAFAACAAIVGGAAYFAGRAASSRVAAGVLIAALATVLYWLVPLPDLMCERRAYLPLAGGALAVSGLVQRLRRRVYLPAALLVVLLAPAMVARAYVWSDPRRLWGEAARLAPENVRPLINLGVVAAEKGERDKALDLFTRAIRLEPRNAEALFNRGKLHLDAGEHDQAIADLQGAIVAAPGMVRARINLAIARIDVRDLDAAEAELRAALVIEPRNPRALTNLGEVLRATNRAPEAVILYRQALDADPTYSHAAARLGVTLENLGDRQGALAAYRVFLARGTTSPTDRDAVLKKVQSLEKALGQAAPGR
ncbi:MAG: hypothetical protein AUI47_03220 [Acidobacteria bacterium 13_1_40CM_2_68_5]|nr:MAG: hypothetical protein AUI47_03220 [Acidobacteria bacterium 13_1_40CM_2_68_5]